MLRNAIGCLAFLQRKPREGRLWYSAGSPPGSRSGHQLVQIADTGDFKTVTGEGTPVATDYGYKICTHETLPQRPRRTVSSVYSSGVRSPPSTVNVLHTGNLSYSSWRL